jgi:tRNA(Ile)-lysidine synthase
VAHTADDQAETVLAHILRGTGLTGLGGMMPVSGHILRPLLECRRDDLRTYLRARKQIWREDATNRDTTRTRARIRKILLPLLEKKFQPAIVEQLSTLASIARDDDECLKEIAEGFVLRRAQIAGGTAKIAIEDLLYPLKENLLARSEEGSRAKQNAAEALSRRIVRQLIAAVKRRAGQLTAAQTAKILEFARSGENGKLLQAPGGIEVRRERDSLVIRASDRSSGAYGTESASDFFHKIDLASGETCVRVPELGCSFRFTMIDWPAKRRETIDAGAVLDRERLREPLILRNRQAGDALRSIAFGNGRKLKRLLNDIHASRWEKQCWPVFTSDGVLAWARGLPVAPEFAPTDGTRAAVVIAEERF